MTLQDDIIQLVAQAADEQNVGTADGPDPQVWADQLCDSVYDGCDAAFERAHLEHPNYIEHSEDEVTDAAVVEDDKDASLPVLDAAVVDDKGDDDEDDAA